MNFFSNLKYNLKPSTVIISIIIFLFLIVIIVEISQNIFIKIEDKKVEDTSPNNIFYSNNKEISLEIAKKYELKQSHSSDKYLIELKSNISLNIYISKKDIIENKELSETVSADKRAFLEEFDATSNISNLKEMQVLNDVPSYSYSFQYLDSNTKKAYYLHVIWIETETGYYIIDIELPVEYLNYYSNIITDTVSGFKF